MKPRSVSKKYAWVANERKSITSGKNQKMRPSVIKKKGKASSKELKSCTTTSISISWRQTKFFKENFNTKLDFFFWERKCAMWSMHDHRTFQIIKFWEWCSPEVSLINYLYAEILWSFVRLPLNQGRMNRIVPAHNSREEFGKIFLKCLSKLKAKKAELSFPRTNTDPRFNFISFRNIEYKVNR